MHVAAGVGTESNLGFHKEIESPLWAYTGVVVLLAGSQAQLQGHLHWSRHLRRRFHVNESNIFQFTRLQRKISEISSVKVRQSRTLVKIMSPMIFIAVSWNSSWSFSRFLYYKNFHSKNNTMTFNYILYCLGNITMALGLKFISSLSIYLVPLKRHVISNNS